MSATTPVLSREVLDRARIQRKICPGRVFWMLHSTYGTWTVPSAKLKSDDQVREILAILKDISKHPLKDRTIITILPELEYEEDAVIVRLDFFTQNHKYLDILKLWIPLQPNEVGEFEINYFNESSGIIPMSVPYATVLGAMLAWVPFQDRAQRTRREMQLLVETFNTELREATTLTCKRWNGQTS